MMNLICSIGRDFYEEVRNPIEQHRISLILGGIIPAISIVAYYYFSTPSCTFKKIGHLFSVVLLQTMEEVVGKGRGASECASMWVEYADDLCRSSSFWDREIIPSVLDSCSDSITELLSLLESK